MTEVISIYHICNSFKQHSLLAPDSKPSAQPQALNRYQLPGTGRLAFGKIAEDRPLFKLSRHSTDCSSGRSTGDVLEAQFSTMDLEAHKPTAVPMDEEDAITPQTPRLESAVIGSKSSNKRPMPSPAINPKAKPVSNASNPYLTGKSNSASTGRPAATAVAGQSGKLAAMARLAALGEAWPEEEDLPGMAMPASSALNSGNMSKEAYNATQRQRKVQTAKRKV